MYFRLTLEILEFWFPFIAKFNVLHFIYNYLNKHFLPEFLDPRTKKFRFLIFAAEYDIFMSLNVIYFFIWVFRAA